MKTSQTVTLIFLTLVALIHLVRVFLQVTVTVHTVVVPMWASVVAFFFVGGLAVWLWQEARPS